MYYIWLSSTHPLNENEFLNTGTFEFGIGLISIISSFICIGLLVIEILIKNFVIPKYLPNLKFNIKINIPKTLKLLLSIIFYILFTFASLPIFILIILFLPKNFY